MRHAREVGWVGGLSPSRGIVSYRGRVPLLLSCRRLTSRALPRAGEVALACVLHRKGREVRLRLHDNSERNSMLCGHMYGDSEIVFMGILGTHAIPIWYPHVFGGNVGLFVYCVVLCRYGVLFIRQW